MRPNHHVMAKTVHAMCSSALKFKNYEEVAIFTVQYNFSFLSEVHFTEESKAPLHEHLMYCSDFLE